MINPQKTITIRNQVEKLKNREILDFRTLTWLAEWSSTQISRIQLCELWGTPPQYSESVWHHRSPWLLVRSFSSRTFWKELDSILMTCYFFWVSTCYWSSLRAISEAPRLFFACSGIRGYRYACSIVHPKSYATDKVRVQEVFAAFRVLKSVHWRRRSVEFHWFCPPYWFYPPLLNEIWGFPPEAAKIWTITSLSRDIDDNR